MLEEKNKMRIKSLILIAATIQAVLPAAFGQHGIARNLQNGSLHDIWTGIVISTNDTTREITLSTGGGQSLVFTGILKDHLSMKAKDGSTKELLPSDIHKGTKIIVFYEARKTKADDGKVKQYNEIYRIEASTTSVECQAVCPSGLGQTSGPYPL